MPKYVAAVQMDCNQGDIEGNTQSVIRLLKGIKEREPETVLAVFPELCLYGYDKLELISEKYSQCEVMEYLEQIAEVCRENEIEAILGAPYIGEKGVENALYFISKAGKVVHVYSKTHLIDIEREVLIPGNRYGICQTSLGKAGFLVCWDAAFAEPARLYTKAGAEVLIVSAAWELPYNRQWELAVGGRGFDNSLPVIAANRTGKDGSAEFFGHAMITDCMGDIAAENISGKEGFVLAEASTLFSKEKRKGFGSQIEELREEIYNMDSVVFVNNLG